MARFQLQGTLLAAATALLLPSLAHAHFVLKAPENWMTQDVQGNPQKTGPCGAAMEGGKTFMPSGLVTPYTAGQTIAITIDETVTHPGHYRVALAVADRSELPAEPTVSAGTSACGSVPIQDPPVFPVLADGMLQHTQAFTEDQTIMVKLPDDVTCEKCTLQVIEFMSSHAAPCFYHHCADISITKAGAGGMSSGGQSGGGAPSAGAGGFGIGGASSGGATSSGMGGMLGQAGTSGGASAGSPNAAGGGGLALGGMGGITGTGGSAPSGAGTGGTSSGIAGSGAASAGTSASKPPAPAADGSEAEGGCSTSPRGSTSSLALASLLALAALGARRRRH